MKYFISIGFFICIFAQAQSETPVVVEVTQEFVEKIDQPLILKKWKGDLTHSWIQPIQLGVFVDHTAVFSYKDQGVSGKKYQWQWTWGYKHPISLDYGLASAQPELYGFKDALVQFIYPLHQGWMWFSGIQAPVSSESRMKFLLLSSYVGVQKHWKRKDMLVEVSSKAVGFLHQYKSAGMFFNPMFSVSQMFRWEVDIKWAALSSSFVLNIFYDYNNDFHYEQSVDLKFSKKWNKKLNMFVGYSWTSSPRNVYIKLDQLYPTSIQAGISWAV